MKHYIYVASVFSELQDASPADLLLVQQLAEKYGARVISRPGLSDELVEQLQPTTGFVRKSSVTRGSSQQHCHSPSELDRSSGGAVGFTFLGDLLPSFPPSRFYYNQDISQIRPTSKTSCSACSTASAIASMQGLSSPPSMHHQEPMRFQTCEEFLPQAQGTSRNVEMKYAKKYPSFCQFHHLIFSAAVVLLTIKVSQFG